MVPLLEQLESFRQFAQSRIREGGESLSMDELYTLWRNENLSPEELGESLAGLRQGIADYEDGRIRPADEVFRDLSERYGAKLDP